MESSKVFGGSGEECHSCESGWTMYIGSDHDDEEQSDNIGDHYVDNNGGDDDDDDDDTDGNDDDDDDEADTDDSMASDASSGPSYPYRKGGGAGYFNKHIEKVEDDVSAGKKAKRQMEKQKAEVQLRRNREEKEEVNMFAAAKRASAQSDSKVSSLLD
ncbi:protein SOB FIVE-LIKE 2-like [Mangifera indica]|uniref:protein SOB FIVE-LIKE 2-like n=1 Tax=Mangifera indica TaxID=29780 RepID=UPI001CFA400E|nr:protein SOB FIVE-LIKE 2-like [Mangifera indica]